MAISYTDGAEIESHLLDLVASSSDRSSSTSIAKEEYGQFAVRYHLSPERSNLLRHFSFEGLDVLELGAGMGAVSRYVAEEAASFTAVEGSNARYQVLERRLGDLDNWTGVVANIQDFATDRRFDVVCLIGVLEYSALYIGSDAPFRWVLKHAAELLKEDGVLILAIENQQGIKYWAGAPEDHTGRLFDGICGYSISKSPRTFCRSDLRTMIEEAGYAQTEEFYPWPDYKLPSVIVSDRLVESAPLIAGEMASDAIEKGLTEGPRYFPDALAILELSRTGRHAEFANSFLFLCSKVAVSETRRRLLHRMIEGKEVAWHYASRRRVPVQTVLVQKEGQFYSKKTIQPGTEKRDLYREDVVREPVLHERRLSSRLAQRAYFCETDSFYDDLYDFFRWSFKHWDDGNGLMRPKALDAIVTNTVVDADGQFRQFDLEYEWHEPLPRSWFVLRNVVALRHAWRMNSKPRYQTLRAMYEGICKDFGIEPTLSDDLDQKTALHSQVGDYADPEGIHEHFVQLLEEPRADLGYARDSSLELLARQYRGDQHSVLLEVGRLRDENHQLNAELTRKAVRIALALDRLVRRIPFAHTAGRALLRLIGKR